MEVRLARPEDADAVADVYIASYRTLTFLPAVHTDEEIRDWIRTVLMPRSEVWVAEDDEAVIGMAALGGDVLEQMYVVPEAQGRGAGSALWAKVCERRPGGFTFWVFQQNQPARRFYERRGCQLVRLTDGAGNEERTPDALYEWRPHRGAIS